MLDKETRKTPQILYVGNNLSPNYLNDLIDVIGNKKYFNKCYIKIWNNNRASYCI